MALRVKRQEIKEEEEEDDEEEPMGYEHRLTGWLAGMYGASAVGQRE